MSRPTVTATPGARRLPERLKSAGLALACAVPLAACGQANFDSEAHSFTVVTVADGFEHPWSLAWLPNGDMLVTERAGRLRIVRDGKLLPEPVPGVPEVVARGQGGLLEVAVHPDFESNRLVYLSYSKAKGNGQSTTAFVRGRLENDALNDVEEIFEAQATSNSSGHFGGKIAFDGNGYMFISVGDRQAPPAGDLEAHPAQVLTNHQGTIVRLHDDGRVPSDNPFVDRDGALPEIWSYGHRHPQGLIFDAATGNLWETEHGPQGGDELNLVRPGLNYGWPVIGYGVNYGGATIHASTEREGMEQPATYWVPSIAASGLMLYTGDAFPEWKGDLFAGGLSGQHSQLARLTLDGTKVVTREPLLAGEYRIRDVRQGPDDLIYIAVDHRGNEKTPVIRLEPTE